MRDLFRGVEHSVVVVRTLERMIVDGQVPGERQISDLGSGVVISVDGYAITAAHLVQAADRVRVEFSDGTHTSAQIVASEPAADIALLKLRDTPASVTPAHLGDSDDAAVGDQIMVVGAPYGLGPSLSVGYVSARYNAPIPGSPVTLGEVFQTDATLNRGNSGGPMFNKQGEVIGIVSYILSSSGLFEGIGFVIASNTVRELLLDRIAFWSGITVRTLSSTQARALNLPRDHGLLVQRVAAGSIGRKLGLRAGFLPATIGDEELILGGDIILSVDGIAAGVEAERQRLRDHLSDLSIGQQISIQIYRRGIMIELTPLVEEGWLHRGFKENTE